MYPVSRILLRQTSRGRLWPLPCHRVLFPLLLLIHPSIYGATLLLPLKRGPKSTILYVALVIVKPNRVKNAPLRQGAPNGPLRGCASGTPPSPAAGGTGVVAAPRPVSAWPKQCYVGGHSYWHLAAASAQLEQLPGSSPIYQVMHTGTREYSSGSHFNVPGTR